MTRRGSGPYLCDGVIDDLLVSHIALVADEQLVDALGGVSVDLLQPLLHVVERVHVGNIVDNADAVSATVVRGGNGAETLLAGGIPLVIEKPRSAAADPWRHIHPICSKERQEGQGPEGSLAHDLQLHGLAVQFDRPDLLFRALVALSQGDRGPGTPTKSTPIVEM